MNNVYDSTPFFDEYAKMSRSRQGLCGAGEWHQLKPLFPPLQGRMVLDRMAGSACVIQGDKIVYGTQSFCAENSRLKAFDQGGAQG